MKIAVINFSGNVGKSTVARHLLTPRLNNAMLIAVESINSDGGDSEAVKGKQFGQLQEALALVEQAVVDVGASNVEDFIDLMRQYRGSHEDFDYFVIPTVPRDKQLRDTISTIDALAAVGVPPSRLRLLFNMVDLEDRPERVFAGLFDYHAAARNFTLHVDAVIHENEIFSKLKGSDQTIAALVKDPTDYKERIQSTQDPGKRLEFAQRLAVKRLACGIVEELDMVFKVLFK